jgi:hypothetical protein
MVIQTERNDEPQSIAPPRKTLPAGGPDHVLEARASPDFSPRNWKGGALEAAEKRSDAVILSEAKDLCI